MAGKLFVRDRTVSHGIEFLGVRVGPCVYVSTKPTRRGRPLSQHLMCGRVSLLIAPEDGIAAGIADAREVARQHVLWLRRRRYHEVVVIHRRVTIARSAPATDRGHSDTVPDAG